MDYGAFVELTGGTQGLLHISEIAAEKVQLSCMNVRAACFIAQRNYFAI